MTSSQGGSSESRRLALAELCEIYTSPLVAYLRARGWQEQDADDLVQGFLTGLLESPKLEGADPSKGRFRSYMLGAIRNYAANHRRNEGVRPWQAGSGQAGSEETEAARVDALEHVSSGDGNPEQAFERDWAMTLIRRALQALEDECRARGHGDRFDELEDALDGSAGSRTHRERAERLGMGEGAVRVALLRMRARLAEFVQEFAGQTVADPGDTGAEIGALFEALARPSTSPRNSP